MSKVLISDDEKYVCEGLRNILDWECLGFNQIFMTANGDEAVDVIKKYSPELVISDVRMPIMDGIQLARYINKFYPDIKMIFISAYDEFQYAKQAIDYGVKSYLLKPVDKEVLRETVLKVMSRQDLMIEYDNIKLDSGDVNTILIRRVQQYIIENYYRRVSLEEVARNMYISPQYLSKKFREITGQNFVDYVMEIKIKKAKNLLKNSNLKVKDISVKLGFSDYTYFCRVFKMYEDITPLQFRAKFVLQDNNI